MNETFKLISSSFLKCDLFAGGIDFHLKGKNRNTNIFGAILSVITLIVTLLSSFEIIKSFTNKINPTVKVRTVNTKSNDILTLNNNEFFFTLNVLDIDENSLKPIPNSNFESFFQNSFFDGEIMNFETITHAANCSNEFIIDDYFDNSIQKEKYRILDSNSTESMRLTADAYIEKIKESAICYLLQKLFHM